jgi:TetR/AcrR family transcriptional repressor of mexJK operon
MDSQQRVRRQSSTGGDTASKPRKGPGRQTPDQTQQRNLELLDKALDLFLENGFERATIDGISAAVGMAKRTVYLRYGNKKRLFKAALQRAIEEWIVPVERLRATETDDVEATLLKIGQMLVENILSPAGVRLMRITNAESGRMPEIGQFTYKQGTAPTIAYLTDLIRRRIRPAGSEVPNPQEAAVAFLYLVVGGPASMTAWGIVLDQADIDRHTRYCVRLFLHGLLHLSQASAATQAHATGGTARKRNAPSSVAAPHDADKLTALEAENRRLKILLADSMLELAMLKNPAHLRGE